MREHGDVEIRDNKGQTHRLKSGEVDVWDLAEKADRFRWNGRWYDRHTFEQIVDDHLASATVAKIDLEPIAAVAEEYCRCGHQRAEHKRNGACSGQKSRDEHGAVTERLILCDCKEFEPRESRTR